MPRRNRNPGAGKPPHNGPARNEPKAGTGWGGPAQGAHEHRPLGGADDEYAQEVRRAALLKVPETEAAKAEMRAVLYTVAHQGDGDTVRIQAADKLLDRLEGKPLARTDLTSKGERTGNLVIVSGVERAED
jgi:hypothetical protein